MERFNSYRDPFDKLIRCTECGQSLELCSCEDYSMMAHDRLFTTESLFQRSVLKHLEDLRRDKPSSRQVLPKLLIELGEVSQIIHDFMDGGQTPVGELYLHLGRLNAWSLRLISEGDEEIGFNPTSLT